MGTDSVAKSPAMATESVRVIIDVFSENDGLRRDCPKDENREPHWPLVQKAVEPANQNDFRRNFSVAFAALFQNEDAVFPRREEHH